VRLFSRGWRSTSRTWGRKSGSSSKKRIPWCASDTSPGIGTWASPDEPHTGDGVMRGTKRARGDDGSAGAGEVGDTMDRGGLQVFIETHRRQDGGEMRQPRLRNPRWRQENPIMVTTPASPAASPAPRKRSMDAPYNLMLTGIYGAGQNQHDSSNRSFASWRSAVSTPLGEPAVDRQQQFVGFMAPALPLPQPGQAHGGPQLQRLRPLTTGDVPRPQRTGAREAQVIMSEGRQARPSKMMQAYETTPTVQ
jgi:hypothetical protein